MMKKHIYRIIAVSILSIMSAACTHNDGDIGDLFGVWRLTELTADGTHVDLYGDADVDGLQACDWAFQGNVVKIEMIYPYYDHDASYGIWSREGDRLLIDFSHTSGESINFDPPAELHLEARGVTSLTMTEMSRTRMTGWYVDSEGVRYEYHLRRLY